MERLLFDFEGSQKLDRRAHVGVVGSGDLEIILEPSIEDKATIVIRTGSTGFKDTWEKVLERFFSQNDIAAQVTINDFGATPGVVSIRLAQALEVSKNVNSSIER